MARWTGKVRAAVLVAVVSCASRSERLTNGSVASGGAGVGAESGAGAGGASSSGGAGGRLVDGAGVGGSAGETVHAAGDGGEESFGGAGAGTGGGGTQSVGGAGDGGSVGGAGDGGSVGGAGDGGSVSVGGAGTSGGGGTSGAPQAFPPARVAEVVERCARVGACTFERAQEGYVTRQCWESRTVIDYAYSDPSGVCSAGSTTTATWRDGAGSTCATAETTYGPACESLSTQWKDEDGVVVAQGSIPYPGNTHTITCEGGERASCMQSGLPCFPFTVDCTEGECPD